MITCHLRYEIDPGQTAAFEKYATGWIPVVTRFGGTDDGCYLPEAQELWQLSAETRCIRRFGRTFLRPASKPSEATEASQRAHGG